MYLKKIVPVILAAALLIMSGCIRQDEKKDTGIGVTVTRNGGFVQVIANETILGAEVSINKIIPGASINSGDNLKIAASDSGKTVVAIAKGGSVIKAGEVLFSIENYEETIEVKLIEDVKKEEVNAATLKRGGTESLLGDFDADGKVGITDYNIFVTVYGSISGDAKYKGIYDISNAVYGTTAGWEAILAINTPDGKVNIFDFVNFAVNYGKTKPYTAAVPKSISITGAGTVDVNQSIVLSSKVIYSDNTEKAEVLKWTSSDAAVATVADGVVKGIKAGNVVITAEKEGTTITTSISITVKDVVIFNGIKVHTKGYTHVWAWDTTKNYTGGVWPGVKMSDEGDGWVFWQVDSLAAVKLIFSNNGASQTADLAIAEKGEFWYVDGKFTKVNQQIDVTPPELTSTPEAGNQEPTAIDVVLSAKDNKDTAPKIYYTQDGTTPTTASDLYTAAIHLTADKTIKAIAVDASGNISMVYSYTFKLNQDATPPEVTPSVAPGKYETTQNVTLTAKDNRDNAPKMYYTEDGTEPTTGSALYTVQNITVDKMKTIKVLAIDNAGNKKIYSLTYYIGKDVKGDFREETIYFVMTTRFYDGDKGNNVHCWDDTQAKNPDTDPAWRGDFKGLIDKLDYIKALGFSAIWITPPVKNISGYDYHGYHASNFMEIDPRYKTTGDISAEESYKKLIEAAHAKGIKIIQDVVFNHTGNFGEENLHPLFKRNPTTGLNEDINTALSKIAPTGMLPADYDTLLPGAQFQSRIKAMRAPLDANVNYHNWDFKGGWEQYEVQLGSIAGDCQDLNTENPDVTKYIRDAYTKWINMGVDAFRVDTVKHISRLTLNKEIVPQLKQAGGENFYMFGEVCTLFSSVWNDGKPAISSPFYTWKESKEYPWGDRVTNEASAKAHWDDNISTAGQPSSKNHLLVNNTYTAPDWSKRSGLDVIDFTMHHNFASLDGAFRVGVDSDQHYNDATWNVTYVDSHDYGPNAVSLKTRYTGTQGDWAERLNLIFSFRGIPTIYYGSEIEFMKGAPIDVGPNAPLSTTGRAYFGDNIEGTVTASDFGTYSASGKVADTLNYPLAKHIRKLNMMRRAIPALQKGQYSTDGVSGGVAFKRRYTDSSKGIDSFVAVAISGSATFTGIPNGKYVDAVTGETINVTGGSLTANASGQGNMRIFVLNGAGIVGDKDAGPFLK